MPDRALQVVSIVICYSASMDIYGMETNLNHRIITNNMLQIE